MNKWEKMAFTELEKQGYVVEHSINRSLFVKGHYISLRNDLFGLWDLIGTNKQEIIFIQVSVKYMSQKKQEDEDAMKAFPVPPCCRKEFWRYNRKYKRFDITIL